MKPLKDFEIKREKKDTVDILRLIGPLDDYSFNRLQSTLRTLHQDGRHRVVIDCDNLDYMSSSAIQSLIDFIKQAREAKGDVILVKVSDKIQRIIDVLGVVGEFKFSGDEKGAIKQLTPAEPSDGKK